MNLEWCCNTQIKPLYNDINYKDYLEAVNRFSKENDNILGTTTIINDLAIQYYIKSQKNISIIIFYPKALRHSNALKDVITLLESKGDIHYIKDINLDYFSAYNLVFQLYSSEKRMKKNSEIIYKIQRLGFIHNNTEYPIKIIVYTLQDKTKQINGKSAEFKMELRNFFTLEDIKTTPYEESDDRYPRGYDYLHVSDDINQSYEYAGIFFNENSMNFLK